MVINLGQGQPDLAFSNLTLNFTQPLFRGGGFAVTLENLTEAERSLLYGIRSYARFRKLFYVSLVAGNVGESGGGITNNPYGLQGLAPNLGRGIGGNLTAQAVGYLPLLQQSAIIANQQQNVAALPATAPPVRGVRGGRADRAPGRAGRGEPAQQPWGTPGHRRGPGRSGIRGLLDSLDTFKLTRPAGHGRAGPGRTRCRPIREQLARFEDAYVDLAALSIEAQRFDPAAPADQFRPRWRRLLTETELVRGTAFAKEIGAGWDALRN